MARRFQRKAAGRCKGAGGILAVEERGAFGDVLEGGGGIFWRLPGVREEDPEIF